MRRVTIRNGCICKRDKTPAQRGELWNASDGRPLDYGAVRKRDNHLPVHFLLRNCNRKMRRACTDIENSCQAREPAASRASLTCCLRSNRSPGRAESLMHGSVSHLRPPIPGHDEPVRRLQGYMPPDCVSEALGTVSGLIAAGRLKARR